MSHAFPVHPDLHDKVPFDVHSKCAVGLQKVLHTGPQKSGSHSTRYATRIRKPSAPDRLSSLHSSLDGIPSRWKPSWKTKFFKPKSHHISRNIDKIMDSQCEGISFSFSFSVFFTPLFYTFTTCSVHLFSSNPTGLSTGVVKYLLSIQLFVPLGEQHA